MKEHHILNFLGKSNSQSLIFQFQACNGQPSSPIIVVTVGVSCFLFSLTQSVVFAQSIYVAISAAFYSWLRVWVIPMQFFPVCYVEGEGLTAFKVASEYVISCLLALAALIFWQRRHHLNRKILVLIIASIAPFEVSYAACTGSASRPLIEPTINTLPFT